MLDYFLNILWKQLKTMKKITLEEARTRVIADAKERKFPTEALELRQLRDDATYVRFSRLLTDSAPNERENITYDSAIFQFSRQRALELGLLTDIDLPNEFLNAPVSVINHESLEKKDDTFRNLLALQLPGEDDCLYVDGNEDYVVLMACVPFISDADYLKIMRDIGQIPDVHVAYALLDKRVFEQTFQRVCAGHPYRVVQGFRLLRDRQEKGDLKFINELSSDKLVDTQRILSATGATNNFTKAFLNPPEPIPFDANFKQQQDVIATWPEESHAKTFHKNRVNGLLNTAIWQAARDVLMKMLQEKRDYDPLYMENQINAVVGPHNGGSQDHMLFYIVRDQLKYAQDGDDPEKTAFLEFCETLPPDYFATFCYCWGQDGCRLNADHEHNPASLKTAQDALDWWAGHNAYLRQGMAMALGYDDPGFDEEEQKKRNQRSRASMKMAFERLADNLLAGADTEIDGEQGAVEIVERPDGVKLTHTPEGPKIIN